MKCGKCEKVEQDSCGKCESQDNNYDDKVVCTRPLKEGHGYMIEYAREFGALIYKLIEEAKETREKVKYHDNLEQDLLHTLENMDQLTQKDAVKMSIVLKQSRNERRFYKDKLFLTQSFLNGILIKEPEKFVRTGLDMVKNQKYNNRVLEDMLDKPILTPDESQ